MSRKEYAQEVAKLVNGEVKEVEKANGVILTGIIIKTDSNIKPCIYIDRMMDDGLTIEEAADMVLDLTEKHALTLDTNPVMDFEYIKPMLRARLYNKATSAEVSRSAACYGFDDLIIIPYIDGIIENGCVKVNNNLLNAWNVSADEVLDIAEENSRQEASIKSMFDVMREAGFPVPEDVNGPITLIATNDRKNYGAYAIIAKLDDLKKRFKNGFTVIPSSVHECIVIDADDPSFDNMVQEVNAAEVNLEEQLSNHAYRIAA